MVRPVFFDPTGRRRRWTRRTLYGLLLALALACAAFATTVLNVPAPSPLPIGYERMSALPFRAQLSRWEHRIGRFLRPGRSPRAALGAPGTKPLTIAFYTSWTDDSTPSLVHHINQIDWVAPTLLSLNPSGRLVVSDDLPMRRVIGSSLHRPLVVPVLQNAAGGKWDGEGTAALMHDPRRRAVLVGDIAAYFSRSDDAGVMFDFENLPESALPDLVRLVGETRAALAPRGKLVSVTMPIDTPPWPANALAKVSDKIVMMAYDEHWQGGQAGPIASNSWFAERLGASLAGIPADKVIVALGNYGYDWHEGHADAMTIEEAWLAARDSETIPIFAPKAGNSGFSYQDGTIHHDVWMLDAAATWNQLLQVRRFGIQNVALWRLGSEDPGFWTALDDWHAHRTRTNLSVIQEQENVDVEGKGEILRIASEPHPGSRAVTFDPRTSQITSEVYRELPTPFEVQRTGARDKLVALTFDDGPDPVWTPKILSILEHYHVPATFFVIGENGVENHGLLDRMTADGDEIGNHSYTHPNMADEARTGISLELNATQRLIEAYTGRSTRLFRAPYFGDAEPTTADELIPVLIAQQHGYTVVGLHVDPGDWKRPGADVIVQRTIDAIEHPQPDRSANVVLLHDGGGDRAQTVAALPAIIERLERDGYRLVPASTLAGLDRDAVMPRVEGMDLTAVRADVAIFTLIGLSIRSLNWMFFFAIALGVVRAVGLTVLALTSRKPQPQPGSGESQPRVTVIIPAYNEEKVIEDSVRRVLDSDYPDLEVIVADDGSRDRTSPIVAEAFGDDPRVRLMTMVNGGKASALNRALAVAEGEIIVALDADTQFERSCIAQLVRWFANPRIGAVAGNAKVGNRVNLVTRWQAVEYVTAQNIERKALARFDAIMVVPGAVGAWRLAALKDVGGYPEDTLAEDQDLTIAIQRKGWKVAYDENAVAWTEAPESFAALSKQRFRWSFGTLQCLWKHRRTLVEGRPSGLASIGMPQAWLFQIVFAVISPLIDLALAVSIIGTAIRVAQHGWAQTQTDVLRMSLYWLCFTLIDLTCGIVAYRLDVREEKFRPLLLLAQRFIYRQLMYSVVIRAINAAVSGPKVGWGKLDRTGRVSGKLASEGGHGQAGEQPAAGSSASEIAT